MKLEHSFEVQAPIERVWSALIDVEYVAPCLPGAEVTGRDEDGSYRGTFTVRLGPTTAAYNGVLSIEQADEAAHRATLHARGTDKRGQGGATATIVNTLTESSAGVTRVQSETDFSITGRLARFGRGGMIEDISARLLRDFADCLQARLAADERAGGEGASELETGAPDPLPSVPEVGDDTPAPAVAEEGTVPEPEPAPLASEDTGIVWAQPTEPPPPAAASWIDTPPLPPLGAEPPPPELEPEPEAPALDVAPVGASAAAAETIAVPAVPEPTPEPEPEPAREPEPEPEPAPPRTESIPPPSYRAPAAGAAPAPRPAAKPVNGLSLFFSVLWGRIKRRLPRRSKAG